MDSMQHQPRMRSLDPDLDGWDNLLEFAQATDPNDGQWLP